MKILVSGGAGYIGGTLTRLLLSQGHAVTVYDNLCHSKRLAVAANASFIDGDIADRTLLEKTLSVNRHAQNGKGCQDQNKAVERQAFLTITRGRFHLQVWDVLYHPCIWVLMLG